MNEREWLEALDASEEEPLVQLAYLASPWVELDDETLNAARRRALFVLAAGGDPHRELDLDGRAVSTLADDLDAPERRAELAAALAELRRQAEHLPLVASTLDRLGADADLAWRALAAALLADELADD
jgi:hypothetical protein